MYGLQSILHKLVDSIDTSIKTRQLTVREQAINVVTADGSLTEEQQLKLLNMLITRPPAISEGILQAPPHLRRSLYNQMLAEVGDNAGDNGGAE
jgi:hypothetical protein